jgi:hypothetical protein
MGPEFLVNAYTTSGQFTPTVGSAGDGSFVIAWTSNGQDGSDLGVFAQRFDAFGQKTGVEFPVNTFTTDRQFVPSVAPGRDGSFVVVWSSYRQDDPTSFGVFGQRFASDGSPAASEFHVNSFTPLAQQGPSVARDPSGNFVVVWSSYAQDGSGDGIFGQRFDAAGAKLGGEFPVNTYTTGEQFEPRVAVDDAGDFVVVWTDVDRGVFGQRFDSTGVRRGPEFQVNTDTSGFPETPRVAADRRGNFVVVWNQRLGGAADRDVAAQRFNSSGEKIGVPFRVNTYTTGEQSAESVALDRRGNFVVAWVSDGQDGSNNGVFAQRFDRAGDALGPEFPVNVYTPNHQIFPDVADDGEGFVVTWTSYTEDGSSSGIFERRQTFVPLRLDVDSRAGSGTFSDRNGVLEPGEVAVVQPAWSHDDATTVADLTGTLSNLSGPAGPLYLINDGAADYGSVPGNSLAGCNDGSPDACYVITVVGARPATHWDVTASEDLSVGGGQLWRIHLGDSFADVPRAQPFYKRIETLLHNGITSGCTPTTYCPGTAVPRDQMAIFLARGLAGGGEFVPTLGTVLGADYHCAPGGTSLFTDIAPTDPACKSVHYVAARNVTLGCSPLHYCPGDAVTRDAMASFIAKAVVAPKGGAAVPTTYGPDPNTGRSYSCDAGSPSLHFTDIAVSNSFCKHIHFLWARGIVDGCTATTYCPGKPVTRDAMAKFLVNAFGLELYGP